MYALFISNLTICRSLNMLLYIELSSFLKDISLKGYLLQEKNLDEAQYRCSIDHLLALVRAGILQYEYNF